MALVRSEVDITATIVGSDPYTYTLTPAGGAPTAGNLIVVGFAHEVRQVSSVAGTNMSFTINGAQQSAQGGWMSQWKCIVGASPGTTITLTMSGSSGVDGYFFFMEFDNANADQSASTANGSTNAATTTHNSGSVTPPTANNMIVAQSYRGNRTWTEDGAFTQLTTGTNFYGVCYLIQTAATAQNNETTSDTNGDSGMTIGAFAGVSAGQHDPFTKILFKVA